VSCSIRSAAACTVLVERDLLGATAWGIDAKSPRGRARVVQVRRGTHPKEERRPSLLDPGAAIADEAEARLSRRPEPRPATAVGMGPLLNRTCCSSSTVCSLGHPRIPAPKLSRRMLLLVLHAGDL